MKKIFSLMFTAMFFAQCLVAQVVDGIKYLNYDKNKSAKEAFKRAYDANPKDPQAIYWLGQATLATDGVEPPSVAQIQAAKAIYQKGLQEVGSDPLLLVGMGHIELLEGGDMNSAKQKFEQAITATTETKGKNKGKPSVIILNAIGRSNAEVPSGKGDHLYAIDKLKQAGAIDLTNPDIYINMGINYLKLGGENGGEAVKAYQEAITRDPKNAKAAYRIGKIYQSQNNKDLFEMNFNNAITADPTFPSTYYAFYEYYANRDVNKAKEYLDKFIANADKDPENEIFVADYLFRAGRNAESLVKIKELDASVGTTTLPGLNILYAYNYDRLGDSIQAKSYLEKYFASPSSKVKPEDYDLAVKVFSKFPGSEGMAVSYLEKAISNDTSKVNKLSYMGQAADLYSKAKLYPDQLKWLQKQVALKGGAMSEVDYYKLTSTAYNAKDYVQTMALTKDYIIAFPDKSQPYSFNVRAAKALDTTTLPGAAITAIQQHNDFLMRDSAANKKTLFGNYYYLLVYYGDKTKNYPKAIEVLDKMLILYPIEGGEENKFAKDQKEMIIKVMNKPPGGQTTHKTEPTGNRRKTRRPS